MARHKLSKLDLLEYALEGALQLCDQYLGIMTDEQEDRLNKDIAEIERRIKLVKADEQRAERKKQ